VVGIALKDRGAILPAGHNPDAAYWFDGITGNWITSSYYLSNLPAWLQAYNALKMPEKYLATPWVSSSNIGGFHTCADDAAPYEGKFASDSTSKFPHYFDASKKVSYDVIRATPFGNTITNELAKEVIINEQLGKDNITDLIAISFSSPDYIGHKFGPQSHEIEDNYARFDKEIESLLSFLAKEIGKENVLVFLTADHGAAEVPAYMNTIKMPSGMAWSDTLIVQPTKAWLQKNYNDSTLFLLYNNQQIYLDQKKIIAQNLDYDKLCSGLSTHLRLQPDIYNAIPMQQLISMPTDIAFYTNWQRGIHPKRSGDIMVVLPLGWLEDMPLGTSHGTSFTYDTHVPLLWWGCNIAPAVINTPVSITDIAVTISQMLEIQEPDANMGVPILDLLKYKK
jgi:predicted AlkP superfamily pyrophosphatase or phosphodiesterase